MAQSYQTVTAYLTTARTMLQDLVEPYRYDDPTLVLVLNVGLQEMGRVRPDIFLDLKYQQPVLRGDTDDGSPPAYSTADIAFNVDGSYNSLSGTLVPVPAKYVMPLNWWMAGWPQFFDVTDSQDQRAQGFVAKFQSHLTTITVA
jgi:hypothetical protein